MATNEQELEGKEIIVFYKYDYLRGTHIFTSDDGDAAGLCAASQDLLTAYNEVSDQLNLIYEHNRGIKTKFGPAVPFEVLKQHIEGAINGAEDDVEGPTAIWRARL